MTKPHYEKVEKLLSKGLEAIEKDKLLVAAELANRKKATQEEHKDAPDTREGRSQAAKADALTRLLDLFETAVGHQRFYEIMPGTLKVPGT